MDVTIGPYETYEDKLFGYKVIPNNEALCSVYSYGPMNIFDLDGFFILQKFLPLFKMINDKRSHDYYRVKKRETEK